MTRGRQCALTHAHAHTSLNYNTIPISSISAINIQLNRVVPLCANSNRVRKSPDLLYCLRKMCTHHPRISFIDQVRQKTTLPAASKPSSPVFHLFILFFSSFAFLLCFSSFLCFYFLHLCSSAFFVDFSDASRTRSAMVNSSTLPIATIAAFGCEQTTALQVELPVESAASK